LTELKIYAIVTLESLEVKAMTEIPVPKDWKFLVEKQLNKASYSEADILKIIYMSQDHLSEIQPIMQWLGQQQGYATQVGRIFNDMYFTMFGTQPPPRPKESAIPEVLLDTPDNRKQAIRNVALAITKLGEEVSDEAVLEELRRRGMKINMSNPTAAISTVLNGFKPQFKKVEGKRGVFIRQQ
jgi:hypothetical protein